MKDRTTKTDERKPTQKQIIFSSRLAKMLIKQGYTVTDIQPNAANQERTIFYFSLNDDDERFPEIVANYITGIRMEKAKEKEKRKNLFA